MQSNFGFGKLKDKDSKRRVIGKGANVREKMANLWLLFGYIVSYDNDGNVTSVQVVGENNKVSPIAVEEFDNSAIPSISVGVFDKKAIASVTYNGKTVPLPIASGKLIEEKYKAQFPNEVI